MMCHAVTNNNTDRMLLMYVLCFFYKLWTYLVMVCQTINLYALLSKHCTIWLYRSSFVVVHCRRPCLSRGRGSSVEQSARICHSVIVTAHVQATPKTVLFAKSYWTPAVSDDLNTFHHTSFYLRLILFGVLAVVLTLCHLNHIRLLTN